MLQSELETSSASIADQLRYKAPPPPPPGPPPPRRGARCFGRSRLQARPPMTPTPSSPPLEQDEEGAAASSRIAELQQDLAEARRRLDQATVEQQARPPPSSLPTEGVYSRGMGRGYSREGGGACRAPRNPGKGSKRTAGEAAGCSGRGRRSGAERARGAGRRRSSRTTRTRRRRAWARRSPRPRTRPRRCSPRHPPTYPMP